jgi:hypothetical protein
MCVTLSYACNIEFEKVSILFSTTPHKFAIFFVYYMLIVKFVQFYRYVQSIYCLLYPFYLL